MAGAKQAEPRGFCLRPNQLSMPYEASGSRSESSVCFRNESRISTKDNNSSEGGKKGIIQRFEATPPQTV